MFRQYFQGHELLAYPLAALVIFLVAFVAIVVGALRRRPEQTRPLADLPLQDDAGPVSTTIASPEPLHVG